MTEVAITGVGLVTAYGAGVASYLDGLSSGLTALRTVSGRGGLLDGEVAGPGPQPELGTGRKRSYLDSAVAEALHDAGLAGGSYPPPVVVLVGQAPFSATEPALPEWDEFIGPAPAGRGAIYLSHACASAAFGLGLARDLVRAGQADVVVVAGSSTLNRYEYASMQVVRAISAAPARPFDRARDGISLGEGAGAIVLEAASSAHRRNARVQAFVAGFASRLGGRKAAASDVEVITDTMRRAVAQAGAHRLHHVHAHATGTQQGDAAEVAAIERIAADLRQTSIPVTSHKGAVGHLLHTSAIPSVISAIAALNSNLVPGVVGSCDPESGTRVSVSTAPTPAADAEVALVDSFGFGGNNAVLALRRGRPSRS